MNDMNDMESLKKAGYGCVAFNPDSGIRYQVTDSEMLRDFIKSGWAILLHPLYMEIAGLESRFNRFGSDN